MLLAIFWYSPVCVGSGRKPRRQIFSRRGSSRHKQPECLLSDGYQGYKKEKSLSVWTYQAHGFGLSVQDYYMEGPGSATITQPIPSTKRKRKPLRAEPHNYKETIAESAYTDSLENNAIKMVARSLCRFYPHSTTTTRDMPLRKHARVIYSNISQL